MRLRHPMSPQSALPRRSLRIRWPVRALLIRLLLMIAVLVLPSLLAYSLLSSGLLAAHAVAAVPSTAFLDSQPPAFTIATAGLGDRLAYSVSDLDGTTVLRGQASASLWQARITLPRLQDGYYVLHLSDESQSSASLQDLPFAVLAPFDAPADSPFGVGAHFPGNDPGLAPLIRQMGVASVRTDATWSLIEQTPGHYSFDALDPAMQALQSNNLTPLLILDYNNRFYDGGQTPYDDTGLQAFARYAAAVVTHYGPLLRAVEVYNEYNGVFSTGPCARQPACYARMLRYTYQAIKAVRPDVTVVGGALYFADLPWFEALFKQGALAFMDAVSDHPYTVLNMTAPELQGLPEQLQAVQQLIKRYNHGQAKPLWISEFGWTSAFLRLSDSKQAAYLVRGAVLALSAGAQKLFWYDFLNDGSDSTRSQQNFGLFRRPDAQGRYTPKPAYVAYAVLARTLAGRSFLQREAIAWGIYDERFSGDLRVLWSTPFPLQVALSTSQPLQVVNMTGARTLYRPINGRIVLRLSAEPLYVLGPVSAITWQPL